MHLIAKDLIFNAKHIDYINLKLRVKVSHLYSFRSIIICCIGKDFVEKVPEFEGIFTSPHRTKIVTKEISEKCRNVKNSFRKAVNLLFCLAFINIIK